MDLAKATCEGSWVQDGSKAKETLLNSIKENFQLELKKNPSLSSRQTAEETESIHNLTIGKPSKYVNPNVIRPQSLFELYERIAGQETRKEMVKNEEKSQKIKELFEKVQKALVEKIQAEISEPARTSMVQRLESIKLKNELCGQDYNKAEFYLNRTAFYQTSRHEFAFCPSVLLGEISEAQLVFLIGHELSHSIDPCSSGITVGQSTGRKIPPFIDYNSKGPENYFKKLENHPYSSILSCLRKESSAGAKAPVSSNDDQKVTNQFFYDNICENDQITEAFCDWMGSEVAPVVLKKLHSAMPVDEVRKQYSMALSTKCLETRRSTDMHATLERRLNGIIGINPQIRKAMNCKNEAFLPNIYCRAPQIQKNESTPVLNSEGVR